MESDIRHGFDPSCGVNIFILFIYGGKRLNPKTQLYELFGLDGSYHYLIFYCLLRFLENT